MFDGLSLFGIFDHPTINTIHFGHSTILMGDFGDVDIIWQLDPHV
jgi:hypothetical protein